jgi:hypothetical protein
MIAFSLKFLMAAALIGSVAAVTALALGFAGVGLTPPWLAVLLIASGVISVIGLAVLTISAQQDLAAKDRKKLLVGGAPRWMRWSTTAMSLIGFALWGWLGIRRYEPPAGGLSSLMAGAFALFVLPSAFSTAFSYSRGRASLNRRCPGGHEVPFDAAFCPVCGAAIQPVA